MISKDQFIRSLILTEMRPVFQQYHSAGKTRIIGVRSEDLAYSCATIVFSGA